MYQNSRKSCVDIYIYTEVNLRSAKKKKKIINATEYKNICILELMGGMRENHRQVFCWLKLLKRRDITCSFFFLSRQTTEEEKKK